jgi:glycosyltransferase involved in cell wall biosynthesis
MRNEGELKREDAAAVRVTIVIPTYNRASLLGGAIESVLAQTREDFELIVSDNASTDGTRETVRRFDDPRLTYVLQESNLDLNAHFNLWIERATSEYLLLLPDDDRLAPGALEATVAALDASPEAALAHGAVDIVDAEGNVIAAHHCMTGLREDTVEPGARFIRESMSAGYRVHASTALIRTAALAHHRLEQTDFPLTDFGLWLRMAADWDIAYVDRTLARYMVHGDSYSSGAAALTDGGYIQTSDRVVRAYEVKVRFVRDHAASLSDPDELLARARRALRRELVEQAAHATLPERRVVPTARALSACTRITPSVLLEPAAYKLAIGSLLGPRVVSALKEVTA